MYYITALSSRVELTKFIFHVTRLPILFDVTPVNGISNSNTGGDDTLLTINGAFFRKSEYLSC